MPADALVTLGARASAGMVLTPKKRNIPSAASEELNVLTEQIMENSVFLVRRRNGIIGVENAKFSWVLEGVF